MCTDVSTLTIHCKRDREGIDALTTNLMGGSHFPNTTYTQLRFGYGWTVRGYGSGSGTGGRYGRTVWVRVDCTGCTDLDWRKPPNIVAKNRRQATML